MKEHVSLSALKLWFTLIRCLSELQKTLKILCQTLDEHFSYLAARVSRSSVWSPANLGCLDGPVFAGRPWAGLHTSFGVVRAVGT